MSLVEEIRKGVGQIQWLGRVWQFPSNAEAREAVRRMTEEGIAPPQYPEWEWLYSLALKEDRHHWACQFGWLGACFHLGEPRHTVCYVEHQMTLELEVIGQLAMPFFSEMRPAQKPKALEKLGRIQTVKLPGGRRRKAKVHKFKAVTPAHVKLYRMPLCCMEMARMAPRKLIERGATNIRLIPAIENPDILDYIRVLEDTLPCLGG